MPRIPPMLAALRMANAVVTVLFMESKLIVSSQVSEICTQQILNFPYSSAVLLSEASKQLSLYESSFSDEAILYTSVFPQLATDKGKLTAVIK